MTHKEIAERGRRILSQTDRNADDKYRELVELFDELDPPRPEPGTGLWWRYWRDGGAWKLGIVEEFGDGVVDSEQEFHGWGDIEYKPARIAGPMQEIVDIPPVSEWDGAESIYVRKAITRAEAERMEADR